MIIFGVMVRLNQWKRRNSELIKFAQQTETPQMKSASVEEGAGNRKQKAEKDGAVPQLTQHRKRQYGRRQRGRAKSVNESVGRDTLSGVEACTIHRSI